MGVIKGKQESTARRQRKLDLVELVDLLAKAYEIFSKRRDVLEGWFRFCKEKWASTGICRYRSQRKWRNRIWQRSMEELKVEERKCLGRRGPSVSLAQNIRTQILYTAWTLSGVETACWWQNEEGGFGRIYTERRTQKLGCSEWKPDSRIW